MCVCMCFHVPCTISICCLYTKRIERARAREKEIQILILNDKYVRKSVKRYDELDMPPSTKY